MLSHEQITSVADRVLSVELAAAGFEASYVIDVLGLDGEPTVSVVARFKPGSSAASGASLVQAISSLRKALRQAGEDRDPLLRYDFPDDEVPALDPSDFGPASS